MIIIENPQDCGMGSKRCCAYIMVGPNGFECARENISFKNMIDIRVVNGTIGATRTPVSNFPYCQTEK